MKIHFLVKTSISFLLMLPVYVGYAQKTSQIKSDISLLPKPSFLAAGKGNFKLNPNTRILVSEKNSGVLKNAALLKKLTGSVQPIEDSKTASDNAIFLKYDKAIGGEEAYGIDVSPRNIVISYSNSKGIFNAIQTLRQLMPVEIEQKENSPASVSIPVVTIKDSPRFEWRGVTVDVARHFYPVSFLKKFIETMALYKLNKLQLHLTDDQGWRIEIKKYPDLAIKGGYRSTHYYLADEVRKYSIYGPYMAIDSSLLRVRDGKTEYGGYYTQEQMKDIIAFAKERNIDIIPEIDMPGHTGIATAIYPELLCENKGPMCPCNSYTYQFAKDVYTEIAALFPFEYMHLGVDEVERSSWSGSAQCRQFMEEKGIKGVEELQSYFTRQMEVFFNSLGKKMIGWDEILEGGISKTATAMYWRTWVPDNLKNILTYQNDVIIAQTSHLYFDLQQNYLSLEHVYNFRPIPDYVTSGQRALIKGIQASLWSEVIPSGGRVEYMAFPRAFALAEIAWTGGEKKDWPAFLGRAKEQFKRLDALKVRYRLPGLEGFTEKNIFVDKGKLAIYNPMPWNEIRYTTDGSKPTQSSLKYTAPVEVKSPTEFNIALFRPNGEMNEFYKATFNPVDTYMEPLPVTPTEKGLIRKYYEGNYGSYLKIDEKGLKQTAVVAGFELPKEYRAPFALKYTGYIDIKETGVYTFSLISDDGSVIKIDDNEITNNDGLHKTLLRNGQAALKKGWHKIEVSFIELQGDITLEVYQALPGEKFAPVSPEHLYH
ncbi:family 20 glycosylhydrolase [Dyadobacter bucti]|uniref:family 20 glycosylhydrolase n=1 Tax=Dyadobacter bucti TaxID=2572203 RepID=UPI003F6F6BD6